MAFKQPRVPQETGGTLAGYVKNIALFLRDFCTASWNADRLKDAEIEKIKKRLDALEGKGGHGAEGIFDHGDGYKLEIGQQKQRA